VLAERGHLIIYGQSSGPIGMRNLDELAQKSLRLSRPNLAHYTQDRTEIEQRASRLFDHLRRGTLTPRFTLRRLTEAADAHRLLAQRANVGSIVLVP
jgi:NADPH2:quinone reductase